MDVDPELPVGRRIQHHRQRLGMSRPVLAQLVGRSAEWLKAVESGRLQVPRLPMLLKLAQALELNDLAQLTGNGHAVPVQAFAGNRHAALTAVQRALTGYRMVPIGAAPSVPHLSMRLRQAWQIRHTSPDHRTQLGALLPDLIRDAQHAVRATDSEQRRDARRTLAGVYCLADFFVAYQPAPELVWMVADRAITEAQEADDPYAIAAGTWAMVQALRDAGRWDEAIELADDAAREIRPTDTSSPDLVGMWGAMRAEVAYVHARRGRAGLAWATFEDAARAAERLGPGYRHVQTSFSQAVLGAHATTVGVELRRAGEALRAAESFDADTIASVPRRARHLIEVARANFQRDNRIAALALLDRSERTASETIQFNGFARDMLRDLLVTPPSGLRSEVRDLCARVGINT